MSNFHKDFPYGKGIWIHDLPNCDGGDINKIIQRCKDNNISYLLIKSADGQNCYPTNAFPQLTKAISDQFHAAGIKVYSWSYVYGVNPAREAALAEWSLDQLGVDGHVFDAETEYEKVANNVAAAEQMLSAVRSTHPDSFLAHAPYPYIDYHTAFPYITFGKYCDAVMPQVYWGTIGISVERMIVDMYSQWSKWEASWTASGHGDSVKPIIPAGQGYDNPQTHFVLTPSEVTDFITRVSGYKSLNFWEYSYLIRDDIWSAIKNGEVQPKDQIDSAVSSSQNAQAVESSAQPAATPTAPQTPVTETPAQTTSTPEKPVDPVATDTANQTQIPPKAGDTTIKPTDPAIDPIVATAPISDTGKTVITVEKDESHPSGVSVSVSTHTPHIDYIIAFLNAIFDAIKNFLTKGGGKSAA